MTDSSTPEDNFLSAGHRAAAAGERILYLYPGAHKTGTSLLQKALEVCRTDIEKASHGVAYRGRYYTSGFHAALRAPESLSTNGIDELRKTAMHVFGVSNLDQNLILSIENLFGEFSRRPYRQVKRVLERLRLIFPDHRIQLVYYVRRQDTFFESAYVQSIHKGSDWDFDAFMDRYGDAQLNWAKITRPMRLGVEPGMFTILPFEQIQDGEHDFIRSFFETMPGLPAEEFAARTANNLGNTNRSLSSHGMKVARAAFKVIDERREREQLSMSLQSIYSVEEQPKFRMDEALRLEIAEKYSAENRKLMKSFGLKTDRLKYYGYADIIRRARRRRKNASVKAEA